MRAMATAALRGPVPAVVALCLPVGCGGLALSNESMPDRSPPDGASVAGEVVLFGGFAPSSPDLYSADTWTWNGTTWTEKNVLGPSARNGASMAPLGDSAVLAGGKDPSGITLSDTWVWNGTSWTKHLVNGPDREFQAMATLNDAVVLFGGAVYTAPPGRQLGLADTWIWNGASWAPESVTGPSGRAWASMATLKDSVVLFGGIQNDSEEDGGTAQSIFGDTWTWNGTSWTQRFVIGPSARWGAAMATLNGTVVLFGGDTGTAVQLGDTWIWNGMDWTYRDAPGPPPRAAASMATLNGRVVLFGGFQGSGAVATSRVFADTWIWDGNSWKQEDVPGPSARSGAAMATLGGP
jgi:Kelch motif/Galactose oxidase, central domain